MGEPSLSAMARQGASDPHGALNLQSGAMEKEEQVWGPLWSQDQKLFFMARKIAIPAGNWKSS